MKNLFDIVVNESMMLCEAFNDPRIYQAWKSLQRYKIQWKDLFDWGGGKNIAWDKVPESDVEEIEPSDIQKLFKSIRRDKRGAADERPFVLLGFKRERLQYVYDTGTQRFGTLSYNGGEKKGQVLWHECHQGRMYMPEKTQFAYLEECDYILKVYSDNANVSGLRSDRSSARAGSWELDREDHRSVHTKQGVLGKEAGGLKDYSGGKFFDMCKRLANDAVNKWKQILAENKFAKSQDTSEVDNAVQDIMNRITKACTNAMHHPDLYNLQTTGISLENLMKKVYDQDRYVSGHGRSSGYWAGHAGLLVNYQKFCEACVELKKGTKGYYAGSDHYMEEREKYKKFTLEKATELDELLKKYGA